jgi:membrane-bound ClpP family serine protease
MRGRLIFAIISTILEEAAIAFIVLFGLPGIGVKIPLPAVIAIMLAWLGWAVFTYRMGSRALRQKPFISLMDMVGSKGTAVGTLTPEGLVKIQGELWVAKSASGRIEAGQELVVVAQDGLKLVVRAGDSGKDRARPIDKGNDNQDNPTNGQTQAEHL